MVGHRSWRADCPGKRHAAHPVSSLASTRTLSPPSPWPALTSAQQIPGGLGILRPPAPCIAPTSLLEARGAGGLDDPGRRQLCPQTFHTKGAEKQLGPELRSDPQQPRPWSQPTGSLALAFCCHALSDCTQRAPSAGSGPLQNTHTGQAPTQVRAAASTLPGKVTEGDCRGEDCRAAPTACWPRTHRFWTNFSAPSLPRAPSGPWAARGRVPRWNGGGRGRGSPRKSRVITWPQTDVILKRTGWPAKVPGYSYTEQVPFSPLREDMLPAERRAGGWP